MYRSVRLAVICMLAASTAFAGGVSPANSSWPSWVPLVTKNGDGEPLPYRVGVPHPLLTVVVRDATNMALDGLDVWFDFSGCSDAAACGPLGQQAMVGGVTNVDGEVSLVILGSAVNAGPTAGLSADGANVPCVRITAGGEELDVVGYSAYDQNQNGYSGADFSLLKGDILLAAQYRSRSDFDGDGTLTGIDASIANGVLLLGYVRNCYTP